MFVVPSKSGIEVVDPTVCQLDGVIDAFETDGAHDRPSDVNILPD